MADANHDGVSADDGARVGVQRVCNLAVKNALVAVVYWSVAVVMRWYFAHYRMWPAPLWFPAGVSMSAVLLLESKAAPGILAASFFTEVVSFHGALLPGLAIAVGNTIAPLVAVKVMRRMFGSDDPFTRVRHVFFFAMVCILYGVIASATGSVVTCASTAIPVSGWPDQFLEWMISDAAGSLLIVPAFLLLWHTGSAGGRLRLHPIEFSFTVATSAMALAYLLTRARGGIASGAGTGFLIGLPLLWAAVRFSTHVAYPMFLITMVVVVQTTLSGHGPYAGLGQSGTLVLFSQMAIGCGASVLLLGAAFQQQREAEDALRQLNQDLEVRVEERTAELQASQRRLEKAAFHDVLTGLPNRRFLEDRFAAARASAERKGSSFGFLLIDLDHFKKVNDSLGHDAGDALLVETARRLSHAVREYDFVARLGGDEFAVLLPETGEIANVEIICNRILDSLNDQVFFNGRKIGCSPSVGLAVFPDDGAGWHEIYKAADLALYVAKQSGRNRWARYSTGTISVQSDSFAIRSS